MNNRIAMLMLASLAYSLATLSVAACSGSAAITPGQTIGVVTVTPPAASLVVGATTQLTAVALDTDGNPVAGKTVSWSSSNGVVATVSSNGLVSALAAGNADIAAAVDGVVGHAALTTASAAPVLQQVSLTPASVTLVAGTTQQFSVTFSWSDGASRSTPVTFSATGGIITGAGLFVAGINTGTYQITAREPQSGLTATSTVVIKAPPPPVGAAEPRPTASSTILFQDNFERYDGSCHSLVAVGGWATSDDFCGDIASAANITTPDGVGSTGTATGIGGHAARFNWPVSTSEQFYIAEHAVPGFTGRQPEYFSYEYRAPNFVYYGAPPRLGKKMFLLLISGGVGRVTINPAEWGLQQSNGVHLNPTFDYWPAGLGSQDAFLAYLTNGQWHRYTLMRLPESSNGAMDGQIRMWLDGYLVIDNQHAGTFTGNTTTIDLAGTFNGGSSQLQAEYYDNVVVWR